MYGAILLFGVTLTLPGFAGLILTIGVAADANIVIFERIKEEARAGKSVRAAISAGYAKGFHTIVDANVVTCITALVLFAVATAEREGLRADAADRHRHLARSPPSPRRARCSACSPASAGSTTRASWARPRRRSRSGSASTSSGAAASGSSSRSSRSALSIVALDRQGPEPRASTSRAACRSRSRRRSRSRSPTVRDAGGVDRPRRRGRPGPRRSATDGDQYKSFQIRLKKLDAGRAGEADERASRTAQRREARGEERLVELQPADPARRDHGDHRLVRADRALRDDPLPWRFAVPILRTLVNDIPITLGVYAISGREVTASTVAAMLTILGYSIYDTIIVFDRVRENMRLMPRASIAHDRERVGLGGAAPVDRHLGDHAAPDRRALRLRRRDAAGLRVRDHRRDRGRRRLDDLHRDAAARRADGARSRVRAPQGRRRRARRSQRLLSRAEAAAAAEPTPETPIDAIEDAIEVVTGDDVDDDGESDARRDARRRRRGGDERASRRRQAQSANGAASGAPRGRMDDPVTTSTASRDPLDRLLALIGPRVDEVRSLLDERPRAGAATRSGSARARASA